MPAITGQRYWLPFDVVVPSFPGLATLPFWQATSLLTDVGQDDRTTGHTLTEQVVLPGLACPRPNLTFTMGAWAMIDLGAPMIVRGSRFTFKITPIETGVTYCAGGGPSTRLTKWLLCSPRADWSAIDILANGIDIPTVTDSAFHTVVQNHPGFPSSRYLYLYLESDILWISPQSGTLGHDIYLSDFGASDEPYAGGGGTPDVPTGLDGPTGECLEDAPTGSLVLTWDANTDSTTQTYEVMDLTRGFIVYIGPLTTCVVSGLTPGVTYEFAVRAVGAVFSTTTINVPGNLATWTNAAVNFDSYNFRLRASGIVNFNNGVSPNWNAYPEGGYNANDDPAFQPVDYYNAGITFGVPIDQIADSRPYSLALKFTGGSTPPATAGSVTGAFAPNRYMHLTWAEVQAGG